MQTKPTKTLVVDKYMSQVEHPLKDVLAELRKIITSVSKDVGEEIKWNAPTFFYAGLFGLLASFALTYEKLQTLIHPGYQPSCNINPIISCQSVMSSPQSEILGIPNPTFGLVAFTALITFGVLLIAGAKLGRYLWLLANAVAFLGFVFIHYLILESLYSIHAICPWCFGVWVATIPVFWGITIFNIRAGHIKSRQPWLQNSLDFIGKHSAMILASWYVLLFAAILAQFWSFWSTLV